MSSTAQAIDSNRAFVPILIFAALALIVFFRLFYLQVIVAGEYSEQAEEARLVSIDVDARRGKRVKKAADAVAARQHHPAGAPVR